MFVNNATIHGPAVKQGNFKFVAVSDEGKIVHISMPLDEAQKLYAALAVSLPATAKIGVKFSETLDAGAQA